MTLPVRNDLSVSTLTRKWYVEVSTDAAAWVAVMGLINFDPNLDDATWDDDSDFDSDGARSQVKTAFGWGTTFDVRRAPTEASATTYDPGQELLRTAAIGKTGLSNSRYVRFYEMEEGGPRVEAYQGRCGVGWKQNGGDMAAKSTATITLQGQGGLSQITHPDA